MTADIRFIVAARRLLLAASIASVVQSCGAVSTVNAVGGRVLCHIMGSGQMPSGSIHLRGGSDLPKPFIYKTASTASTASTAESGADTIQNLVRPQRSNSHPILRVKSFGELSSVEYDNLLDQLWNATIAGSIDEVFQLVKQGAWPNHLCSGTSLQTSALHLAAMHGHDEVIELLVHMGADVNLANNQGMTSLHMASQLGLVKVVKTLLALGADPMLRDVYRETAKQKAQMAAHESVLDLLRLVEESQHQTFSSVHRLMRASYT